MTHQPGVYVPLRALFLVSAVFVWILSILVGNEDIHKSLAGFEL